MKKSNCNLMEGEKILKKTKISVNKKIPNYKKKMKGKKVNYLLC